MLTQDESDRIINRLPQFYKSWDKESIVFTFIDSFADELRKQKKDLINIRRAHWIDTSYGKNLNLLGNIYKLYRKQDESDGDFRNRIKRFLFEFAGGGTKKSILAQTVAYLNLKEKNEMPKLLENPIRMKKLNLIIQNGDGIKIQSGSIKDEDFTLELSLAEEGFEILDPMIYDQDTNLSIKFHGKLRSGERLRINSKDKSVSHINNDSTNDNTNINISNSNNEINTKKNSISISDVHIDDKMKVPRKRSTWIFKENTTPKLGRFDESFFDEHFYEVNIPKCSLNIEWRAKLLSSFELQIDSESFERSGVSIEDFSDLINSIKAAGVISFIEIVNKINSSDRQQNNTNMSLKITDNTKG
ncbi:MAG TPA: hypothetical protein VFV86_05265 [Nitrososphaeraceae archaeon]|nr:hypothetical protein [Nitrososphaeraceae archaeon]